MSRDTIKTLRLIYNLTKDKQVFIFWLFVRFISAFFPITTIYLFSKVIGALENKAALNTVALTVLFVLLSRLLDNFTRLLSTKKLDYIIEVVRTDIHDVFMSNISAEDKESRYKAVQAIRNFSDASATTLSVLKQPGVDAIVSFAVIPIILLLKDPIVFVIQLAYIIIYYCTDIYTTKRYAVIKNAHNSKVESYYAKLQEVGDFHDELKLMNRMSKKLNSWGFIEWLSLQNIALFFYILVFSYLVYSVTLGHKGLSDLVLILGYIEGTQAFMNNISSVKDSMADTKVALHRLLDNNKSLAVDYDDLVG